MNVVCTAEFLPDCAYRQTSSSLTFSNGGNTSLFSVYTTSKEPRLMGNNSQTKLTGWRDALAVKRSHGS